MTNIAVVIPTRGASPTLAAALGRLAGQGAELVVASDATDPDPMATSAVLPPGARHVQARLPGASAARNAGWRAASAELILLIDDDVLADSGLVAEHLAGHLGEPDPAVAILGHVRWADGLPVTPFMHFVERGLQFHYHELTDGQDAGWGRLYTANVSLKRATLEQVDGFDEQAFPFGYEDLDLARRIPGLVVRYRRAASAEHMAPMTLPEWRTRVGRIAIAERAFVARYPGVRPFFFDLFAAAPSGRGLSGHLAGVVPVDVPWLGPRVRASAEGRWLRDLGRHFMAAWNHASGPK